MTNPNNIVGTNAGFNGRTTPNAFNDVLQIFSGQGIVYGWATVPKTGMTVQLGGSGSVRDVAIAEDNAGNRTTINNRTATPVEITLAGAPATGNRYDSIIAYVNNPQDGTGADDVDFPSQIGVLVVSGTAAANPSVPNDAAIRSAITADGGNGVTAYYAKLADVYVGQGVTTIGSGVITANKTSIQDGFVGTDSLASTSITTIKLASSAVTGAKIQNSTITGGKLADGAITTAKVADEAITGDKIDWATTRTTLWSGSLNTTGSTTYNFSENAYDFSYLLVTFGQSGACKKTEIFPTSSLTQANAVMMQSPSVYVCATLGIKNSGAGFEYTQKNTAGWGDCYIYKIEGVK